MIKVGKHNHVEFHPADLTPTAWEVYSNSDFYWYCENGVFSYADDQKSTHKVEVGDLQDVSLFLECFA